MIAKRSESKVYGEPKMAEHPPIPLEAALAPSRQFSSWCLTLLGRRNEGAQSSAASSRNLPLMVLAAPRSLLPWWLPEPPGLWLHCAPLCFRLHTPSAPVSALSAGSNVDTWP